ncbi:MAG: aspartate carbamoyltransferase catalytic subunit [Thermoanaerobacteraceae bacterium]|nr:aspartate carbamoyltransferase catalytic subunit [Thermoanaerobacteraceae bacterium]
MKDLLGLRDMSRTEIEEILDEGLRQYENIINRNFTDELKDRTLVTLFYEPSTRTRASFELAAKNLGARVVSIETSTSSVRKGESLIDTMRTLESMGVDYIAMRHPMTGAAHLAARFTTASIINGGDGINEHPTQALLDMLTMLKEKGRIDGLNVAIVGDILHSRVARSNIFGLTKMGARVRISGPSTMIPSGVEFMNVEVCEMVEDALKDADVIMTLRIQMERQAGGFIPSLSEYTRFYGITEKRVGLARPDAIIMHPGPMNRGVEIDYCLASSDASVIEEQVTMGVALRMAVLKFIRRETDEYPYQKRLCCR